MTSVEQALTECRLIDLGDTREVKPWFCKVCGNKFKTMGGGHRHIGNNWLEVTHRSAIKKTMDEVAIELIKRGQENEH